MNAFGAMLLCLALWHAPLQLSFMIEWTDWKLGTISGLMHGLFTGIPWVFVALPWIAVVLLIYRRRKWQRFRTLFILLPGLVMFVPWTASLPNMFPVADKRFLRTTQVSLPANRTDLHTFFVGGGIADYSDAYFFRTTPNEVQRLIDGMGMELTEKENHVWSHHPLERHSQRWNTPAITSWPDHHIYARSRDGWTYLLITDGERTQVYMLVHCI